jgi:hypothetical protein
MAKLVTAPDPAVRLIGDRLTPVKAVGPDRVARLLQKLDRDKIKVCAGAEGAANERRRLSSAWRPASKPLIEPTSRRPLAARPSSPYPSRRRRRLSCSSHS